MNYRERLEEILNGEIKLPKVPLVEKVTSLDINRTIVVYGAGYWGRKLVEFLEDIHPISFFTDQNPKHHGRIIVGTEVLIPTDVSKRCKDVPFVIISPQIADQPEVMNAIQKNLNLIHGLTSEDVYIFRIEKDFPLGVFPDVKYWSNHKEEVLKVFDMFTENTSKEIFVEWMRCAFERDMYNGRIDETGYFHNDLFTFLPEEVIVDCGAYTGDTVLEAIKLINTGGGNIKKIYAFEPDPENYKKLLETSEKLPDMHNKIDCFSLAISDDEGVLKFSASGTGGAQFFEDGPIEVRTCSLDSLLLSEGIHHGESGVLPTLIKMDIEGAETLALYGAEGLIRAALPVLAICVYHKPEDIINIPLWIQNNYPSYDFYIRKTVEISYVDYVLIAVPPDRKVIKK